MINIYRDMITKQQLKLLLFLLFYNLSASAKKPFPEYGAVNVSESLGNPLENTADGKVTSVGWTVTDYNENSPSTVTQESSTSTFTIETKVRSVGNRLGNVVNGKVTNLGTTIETDYDESSLSTAETTPQTTDRTEQIVSSTTIVEISTKGKSTSTITTENSDLTSDSSSSTIVTEEITSPTTLEEITTKGKVTTTETTTTLDSSEVNCIDQVNITDFKTGPIKSTSISVKWKLNTLEPKCIKDVKIIWYDEPSGKQEQEVATDTKEYTITKLEPCNLYNVSLEVSGHESLLDVKQINDIATKSEDQVNITDFKTGPIKSTSISVKWKLNTIEPKCIKDVKIIWYDELSGKLEQDVATDTKEYTITKLEPCNLYNVSLEVSGHDSLLDVKQINDIATEPEVPSSVIDLTVTTFNDINLAISWDKPKKGSLCVTGYNITYNKFSAETIVSNLWSEIQDPFVLEYNITEGLEGCQEYLVEVAPIGRNDTNGKAENDRVTTGYETPSAVKNIVVEALSDTTLSVRWEEPELNLNCLAEYNASIQVKDSKTWTILPKIDSAATAINITNLEPCEEYVIKIAPIGLDGGKGEDSNANGQTRVGVPSKVQLTLTPEDPTPSHKKGGVVQLKWTKPEFGSKCVSGYRITYFPTSNPKETVSEEVSPEKKSKKITKLAPCTDYNFTIAPFTASEDLPSSENRTEQCRTKSLAPSKIKVVKFDSTETSILVSWEEPEYGTACILEYKVTFDIHTSYRSALKERLNEISVPKDQFETLIDSLKPCVNYEISVQALGEDNKNSGKSTEIVKTLSSNISEVKDMKVSPGPTSLLVEWSPPTEAECVGFYKVSYKLENRDEFPEEETKDLQMEFTDLEPCVFYTVIVTAVPIDTTTSGAPRTQGISTIESNPSSVQNLNIIPESGESITASWNPPMNSSHCVHEYKIKYQKWFSSDSEEETIVEETTTTNSIILKKLAPCTNYKITVIPCTVTACNGDEISDFNSTLTAPTGPPRFKKSNIDKTWAELDFDMPDLSNYHCTLLEAKIICEALESKPLGKDAIVNVSLAQDPPPTKFSVNVTAISAFTHYTCVATIKNKEEESSKESEAIKFSTLADVPSAPTVKVIEPKSGSVNIEWINSEFRPGNEYNTTLKITKKSANYYIPPGCSKDEEVEDIYEFPIDETYFEYKYPEPYTHYKLSLIGKTEAGFGPESNEEEFLTYPDVPEPVQDFQFNLATNNETGVTTTTLAWALPCKLNGRLKGFWFRIRHRRQHNINPDEHDYERFFSTNGEEQDLYAHMLPATESESEYIIEIRTEVQNISERSSEKEVRFATPAGIPETEMISLAKVKIDPRATDNPKHKARLKFPKSLFSEGVGQIMYYALILAQKGYEGTDLQCGTIESEHQWPDTPAWTESETPIKPYQATQIRWRPTGGESNYVIYILGEENCASSHLPYCNGPLRPSTNYSLRVRGFTRNGYNETMSIYFKTEDEFRVGIILTILLIILIMGSCLSFIIYFKNGNPSLWSKKLCAWNGNNPPESVLPPPILQKNFHAHCAQLFSHENQLSSELLLLETLSDDLTMSTYIADLPHNRVKNRYPNIKPYDATRVKLHVSDEFSDYINASYIKGYKGETEYIATQGPKEETVDDFWQMVFENEVKQIVMVTNLTEKGKTKCYKYYPDELDSISCGNGIDLDCITMEYRHTFTIRHILVKKGNQEKKVTHIQFHEWPDFGVPSSTDALLKLCREMRSLQSQNYGVILVHCSAGVGRTGTVIVVDILVQAVHENRKIDVFGTVFNLRKQRPRMVQTQEQYKYIYRSISDEILNPRVFQDKSTYSSYYNRGLYGHSNLDLRRFSTESAI